MTEQQINRERLREAAEAHLRYGGGGDDLANGVLALLAALGQAEADRDWNYRSSRRAKEERIKANARAEQAEHRATRAEAQSAIRGRAVVMYRERAREAEARINAVQGLTDQADHAGEPAITATAIQWAIDGTATPPRTE